MRIKCLSLAWWLVWGLWLGAGQVFGQQDPMFTKYMFNSLAFNPAYAGTNGYFSGVALVRDQWLTWGRGSGSISNGAPLTYTISAHAPLKKNVGLGGFLSQDRIGSSTFSEAEFSYAYRLKLKDGMQLSLGLQAGMTHLAADFSDLQIRQPGDPNFFNGQSAWMPNAGAGAYLYTERFYVGASVPRLFESRLLLNDVASESGQTIARNYRHFYIASGVAIPLPNPNYVFKPSVLIKGVGWLGNESSSLGGVVRTPTEFDIDASLLINQTVWVGAAFRSTFDYVFQGNSSHDSADIWAALLLKNGVRVGMAYDYSLTELQQFGNGSMEIMVGYDMNFNADRIVTPRYF